MPAHLVEEDTIGHAPESPQYEYIVCRGSPGETTLVRQPWQDEEDWKARKAKFRTEHPQTAPI